MNLKLIPKDSLVQQWLTIGKFTEIPWSYLIAICLSGISHLLRRNVILSLGKGISPVTPNLSVILIGHAGVGKGQAMQLGKRYILKPFSEEREVRGATSEGIMQGFANVQRETGENPACAYLIYGEMASGIGKKDYQQGIIPTLTDILSDEDVVSHATRHNPIVIHNPTMVVQAGSTKEWFHQLPENALEGGFLPRFFIIAENEGRPPIALPEREMDGQDRWNETDALRLFWEGLEWIEENFKQPYKMFFENEAEDYYVNWYNNRFKEFSSMVRGYAQRSRQVVARFSMLMAISRRQKMISLQDVEFALAFLRHSMVQLESVMLPLSEEARCIAEIKEALPATSMELVLKLRPKHRYRMVMETLGLLQKTNEIVTRDDGKWYTSNQVT